MFLTAVSILFPCNKDSLVQVFNELYSNHDGSEADEKDRHRRRSFRKLALQEQLTLALGYTALEFVPGADIEADRAKLSLGAAV